MIKFLFSVAAVIPYMKVKYVVFVAKMNVYRLIIVMQGKWIFHNMAVYSIYFGLLFQAYKLDVAQKVASYLHELVISAGCLC